MSFSNGDLSKEVSDFLTSRRARITPESVGLPNYGGHRRVAGLRREEVAMLAGVSVDYYTRIERGNINGVSDSVLNAVMRVLNLDATEISYLRNLAGLSGAPRARAPKPKPAAMRPSLLKLLDAMNQVPAYIRNGKLEILAANALAKELFSPLGDLDAGPVNVARFFFLHPNAAEFFVEWPKIAADTVGVLRAEASKDPYDKDLTDLIGELCTRSEFFATSWAAQHVYQHTMGVKKFRHPAVGEVSLNFEALELPTDDGLTLLTYVPDKGSASEDALKLLAMQAFANR